LPQALAYLPNLWMGLAFDMMYIYQFGKSIENRIRSFLALCFFCRYFKLRRIRPRLAFKIRTFMPNEILPKSR